MVMASDSEREMVQRLVDAANARDWEALLDVCADDVSLVHPLAERPYQGKDQIRDFFVLSSEELPDQFVHVDAILAERGLAALEGRISATAQGEPTVTPCAFFFSLSDFQVRQIRMYYDTSAPGGDE